MDPNKIKARQRLRRRRHVRKRLFGTPDRPRLSVSRSLKHISCQVIDDTKSVTLCSASTQSPDLRADVGKNAGNRQGAALVGALLAARAKKLGITKLKFDRSGFKYHGRIAALADAVRKNGIEV
ncbi:MAG: 50S ribosomal protein L18 [Planctomycetes bacterium]|nr:50S ribosomal protein L18 [Planctomycetota bacterium]